MKVVRVETLGDIVAYKAKEIQVLGSVYDKVPTEFKDDFEVVCNSAKMNYDTKVAEAKAKGEKPKSAQLKKESIETIIKPFLNRFGIEEKAVHQRVISTTNPRIPEDNEKVTVAKRQSILADTDVNLEELGDIFDNFDSDALGDEVRVELDQTEGAQTVTLGVGTDELFDGDEFDFEGLLD